MLFIAVFSLCKVQNPKKIFAFKNVSLNNN